MIIFYSPAPWPPNLSDVAVLVPHFFSPTPCLSHSLVGIHCKFLGDRVDSEAGVGSETDQIP